MPATKPPCASHATALQRRALRQYPQADNSPPPFLLASLPPSRTKAPAPCPARSPPPAGCRVRAACAEEPGGVAGGAAGPTGVAAR